MSEIKDVNCYMKIVKNALLIEWKEKTYITNLEFVEQLVNGKLKKKDGNLAKSIKLGILTKDEKQNTKIDNDNDNDIFLTLKNKSFYFSVDGQLLIVPISNVKKLLASVFEYTKMGMFN